MNLDPNAPRYRWTTGRITDVHPGRDGNVRVCNIQTETGNIQT